MKRTRTIGLRLNEVECRLLDEVVEQYGYSAQEALRIGLRLVHKQETVEVEAKKPKEKKVKAPPVIEVQGEFKMENRHYCENVLNGRVEEVDGKQVCVYKMGACEITDPLDTIQD